MATCVLKLVLLTTLVSFAVQNTFAAPFYMWVIGSEFYVKYTQEEMRLKIFPFVQIHAMYSALGMSNTALHLTADEFKKHRTMAKTIRRLRQRLDTMESTDDVVESTYNDMASQTYRSKSGDTTNTLMTFVVRYFYERVDRRLAGHPQIGEVYAALRGTIEKEYENVDMRMVSFDNSQIEGNAFQDRLTAIQLFVNLMNKIFLHSSFRRGISSDKNEYFVLARSILELAKKPNNLEKFQLIYDQTLTELVTAFEFGTINLPNFVLGADPFHIDELPKALFQKLKENFEKSPSFNYELRTIQKYVYENQNWDKTNNNSNTSWFVLL